MHKAFKLYCYATYQPTLGDTKILFLFRFFGCLVFKTISLYYKDAYHGLRLNKSNVNCLYLDRTKRQGELQKYTFEQAN